MITELRKSIGAILYERTTSPLYGTLILSWAVCNWRIVYLTLFINDTALPKNITKIEYITYHYLDPCRLYLYPFVLTVALIGIVPFAANLAYWASIEFRRWRIEKKQIVDNKTPITQEKADALRQELADKDIEYKTSLSQAQETVKTARSRVKALEQRGEQNSAETKKFKILRVMYGSWASEWRDVTDTVMTYLNDEGVGFAVKNDVLRSENENDPAPGSWKQLLVTFQADGKIQTFSAVEGDDVSVSKTGHYVVHAGSQHKAINGAIAERQHKPL